MKYENVSAKVIKEAFEEMENGKQFATQLNRNTKPIAKTPKRNRLLTMLIQNSLTQQVAWFTNL